jgi:hypothetical protein
MPVTQSERAEHVGERDGPTVRADGEHVGDFADESGVLAAHGPVVDDGAAEAFT